ncbi:MAG: energy-coupled thiamine transporter ThiT [Eubacteriaceae bacterium]|nr:energy-coupled thiamine transporter ThiT [Eubacteriaceae bacterium]
MDLQIFFESVQGKVALAALLCICLLVASYRRDEKKQSAVALVYCAVSVALAFLLNNIILFRMPQGGSVTPLSMFAITVIGYWFGPRSGICAGCAFGLLNMLVSPYVISPMQGLLDYPLAYGMLGLSGVAFRERKYGSLVGGLAVGVLGRFACSFLSGVLFFGEYAPVQYGAVLWSIVYNISFMGAEFVLTCIALAVKPMREAVFTIRDNIANTNGNREE